MSEGIYINYSCHLTSSFSKQPLSNPPQSQVTKGCSLTHLAGQMEEINWVIGEWWKRRKEINKLIHVQVPKINTRDRDRT